MSEELKNCVVHVSDWQMQCCGEPFKIGGAVEWLLHRNGKPSEIYDGLVDYYYQHHNNQWRELYKAVGVVDRIMALYYYEIEPPSEDKRGTREFFYKKAVEVNEADGWEADDGDLKFRGYEVYLSNCTIRPAEKYEVTFS
ncbi:MAG: hypothetical protein LBI74_10455 [Synergistaceae bacterium]|jgi:hypothetical protein|nr:hypothetical protein [Synergistaceae bacterium]